MNTDAVASGGVCPKCEHPVTLESQYCPGCGYEFPTGKEGVGRHEFAFPVVEYAYKPSGKTTGLAIGLMVVFGVAAALAGGPLLYLVHGILATVAAWLLRTGICIAGLAALVVEFGGYLLAAPLLGFLIGGAVSEGAKRGKNRNQMAKYIIGGLCGLVGFGSFLLVYYLVLKEAAFNSAIDFIKLGWNIISIIGVAVLTGSMDETPFCEDCEQWMTKHALDKRPIRFEGEIIDLLTVGQFERLAAIPADAEAVNFCQVDVWCCDCENATCYVDMKTTQTRYTYTKNQQTGAEEKKPQVQVRRVFSMALPRSEVKPLLTMQAAAGQPSPG